MEVLTRVHEKNLVRWAADRPEVVVFSGDLTGSTEIQLFKDTYPDRFFSMGLTEQNMMSWAAGMAREGFTPFVHTFAVFMYRRALDQITISIAYPNLPVRMFGFLPGVTTPGGVTHQAIDDVAVLRGIPNMTILETGDATDVESVLDLTLAIPGPVYIRMIRGEIPRLFAADEPMQLGKARVLSQGDDIALLSTGICTEEAMRATQALQARGVGIQHLHVSTLKPFDDPLVVDAIAGARFGVITMENHTVVGGLASATSEVIARRGLGKKLIPIGLQDTFIHGASRPYLMREYGLDAPALVRTVEQLTRADLQIGEDDLAAVRLNPVHSAAKTEAL
ncbi:MAG: transketolase [Anaerolineae bacterium]|nr:transketolase [Anaerolineae bacterium]